MTTLNISSVVIRTKTAKVVFSSILNYTDLALKKENILARARTVRRDTVDEHLRLRRAMTVGRREEFVPQS